MFLYSKKMKHFIDSFFQIFFTTLKVSYSEIKQKYNRSILGSFWITLNMLITLLMLGIVFSSVFKIEIYNYLPYVYCGLLSWGFISSIITDCTQIYLSGNLKFFNFNVYYLQLKIIFKQIITFFHNLSIYFLILIFLNNEILNINYIFLIFPGLLIYAFCSLALIGILAPLCAKYLDFGFMITNFVYILFLVSPVFWDPNIMSGKKFFIDLNPIFHFINIIREPMLGRMPEINSYFICISISLILFALNFFFSKKLHKNLSLYV